MARVNIVRADTESVSLLHFSQIMEVPLIPGQTTYQDSDPIETSAGNSYTGDTAFRIVITDVGRPGKGDQFESFFGGEGPRSIKAYPEGGLIARLSIQSPFPRLQITSVITPAEVNGQAVITGSNFGDKQGDSTVSVNDVNLYVREWSDTRIIATMSANASAGTLVVTVKKRRSNKVPVS